MKLASDEEVRDARRANMTGSLELAGRMIERLGPRMTYAVVQGRDQWFTLAAYDKAARLYASNYPQELAEVCADLNEPNIAEEYEQIMYLLITRQFYGPELERAMSIPNELGFYVATQIAEAAYYANHMRALDAATERLACGFTGPSSMHKEWEHKLSCGFKDRLSGAPVNLSELLVIKSTIADETARFRAHLDLDRHFDLRQNARLPGMFI